MATDSKAPLAVTVHAGGIAPYPQDTEACVYFCCLEALQNTAKYAHATQASITLTEHDGALVFTVADDGAGFDPATTPRGSGLQNMADRLDAHGGGLTIDSTPAGGTTVTGQLPARTRQQIASRPTRNARPDGRVSSKPPKVLFLRSRGPRALEPINIL